MINLAQQLKVLPESSLDWIINVGNQYLSVNLFAYRSQVTALFMKIEIFSYVCMLKTFT